MPYIPQERRQELYPLISAVAGEIRAAVESGIGKRGGERLLAPYEDTKILTEGDVFG